MAQNASLVHDINAYDFQSSPDSSDEAHTPEPKRHHPEVDTPSGSTPLQSEATPPTTPRKRPDPTEGYIYGFKLPFKVDNPDYCVVKVGKTGLGQLARRLRDHNSEFKNATGVPITLYNPPTNKEDRDIIKELKWNQDVIEVFLLSHVKDGLRAAEYGARECIGVAPFNTVPTFKAVFQNSKRVTTTEWIVTKKEVFEHIQVGFWDHQMDSFESADSFLDKLRQLNKRKHVELTISLETLNNEIYRTTVKAPEYCGAQ